MNRVRAVFFVEGCLRLYQTQKMSVDRELIKLLLRGGNRRYFAQSGFVRRAVETLERRNNDSFLLYFLDDAITATLFETAPEIKQRLVEVLRRVSNSFADALFSADVRYSVGKLFYIRGKYDECLKIFTGLLEKHGDDETYFYYLAACHEARKNWQTSLFYYDKASELMRIVS